MYRWIEYGNKQIELPLTSELYIRWRFLQVTDLFTVTFPLIWAIFTVMISIAYQRLADTFPLRERKREIIQHLLKRFTF